MILQSSLADHCLYSDLSRVLPFAFARRADEFYFSATFVFQASNFWFLRVRRQSEPRRLFKISAGVGVRRNRLMLSSS